MKKTILNKLLAPIGKGILIFAVFGLSLYAYAVNFPTPVDSPATVTGVVGQLVGFSASPVDGDRGSYKDANDLCVSAIPGSHICIAEEITRSYVNGNLVITNATNDANSIWTISDMYFAWINNGPPGYTGTLSNDCGGWSQGTSAFYGAIWNVKAKNFVINTCDNTRRYACCM